MVFPLVVLAVTGLLTVNIHLFCQVRDQSLEHVESRLSGESLAFDEVKLLRSRELASLVPVDFQSIMPPLSRGGDFALAKSEGLPEGEIHAD